MASTINYRELLEDALKLDGEIATCYSLFHDYSFGNQMWLWFQFAGRGVKPCPVATYNRWKELGRQIQKGSKAYRMCVPSIKTKIDEETGEKVIANVRFFDASKWFALSDTDGEDFEQKVEIPEFSLSRVLENLGIKQIDYDMIDGNCQGFCKIDTGDIAISPLATDPIGTACHEIAHSLLHAKKDGDIHDDRGIHECEAESVSMLTCMALGVITPQQKSESVGYIKSFLKKCKDMDKEKLIDQCAKRIFSTVDKILKANKEVTA